MKFFHNFVSTVPPGGNPGNVTSSNWNDAHQGGMVSTPYTADGVVPTSVDYIRANGTFTLQLTSGSQTFNGPSGSFAINQMYFAKNVGSGVVTFTDLNGALFEGQPSYELTQQGQWAIFIWNGTDWDVFGGMSA